MLPGGHLLHIYLLRRSCITMAHRRAICKPEYFQKFKQYLVGGVEPSACTPIFTRHCSTATFGSLQVKIPSSEEMLQLNNQWLRDHCRCSQCYNSTTSQRSNDILSFDENLKIMDQTQHGDSINVEWSDGHRSTYSLSWLLKNTFEGKYQPSLLSGTQDKRTTWDGASVKGLNLKPILHGHLNDDASLVEIFRRIARYGFAQIEHVPATTEETNRVFEHVCRIANTVFGFCWETGTNFDHKDTGYLNGYLEAHTDTTYFSEAQGLLVFHCTHFEGTGGESFLVDGFHVAEQLKQKDPEAYNYLSEKSLEAEYIEPGEHFSGWGPVLRHHPITGELEQFRLNMLDRAPMAALRQSEADRYYRCLRTLVSLVRQKENEYWFRLSPGTVLIIDNWRLLHGRASFEGKRVLRGCYYSRSDYVSRSRHFGIQL